MGEQKPLKEIPITIKVGTIITLVSVLIGFGIAWEKIQARLRHLDGKTDLYAERYDVVMDRLAENEKSYIKIETQLNSIEALILDVKQRIQEYHD